MGNPEKYEFVKRPENIGKIIQGQDNEGKPIPLPLIQTLREQYDYLLKSLFNDIFFFDENTEVAFLKEIVYDKKVVGFSAWRLNNEAVILIFIYILPEYRGKNLLYDDIKDSEKTFNKFVFIDCPNQYVIKSLIKNNLARYINDYLVNSDIPFTFTITELNEEMKKYVETHKNLSNPNALVTVSQIYDTNISAVVSLENEFLPNLISPPLDVDIRDFDALQKRLSINYDNYFKKVKKSLD